MNNLWCNGALPMHHPYYPLVACVALFSGFLWTRILVPGGANGMLLKLKISNSCSWADIFGFILHLRIRFMVVFDWYKSLSQSFNGAFGLTLQNPAIKWFLNVRIARLVVFCQCMFGGTNWKSIFYLECSEWGCWNLHCQFLKLVFVTFGC